MIEYNLEAELKKCIKSMHSGYIPKKDADHIRGVMQKALEWITDPAISCSPKIVRCRKCKYWTDETSEHNPELHKCKLGTWSEPWDFCSRGDDGKTPMPGVYARPQ